jgi:hypothetical protein
MELLMRKQAKKTGNIEVSKSGTAVIILMPV